MKKHDPHADRWGALLAAHSFVQRAMNPEDDAKSLLLFA